MIFYKATVLFLYYVFELKLSAVCWFPSHFTDFFISFLNPKMQKIEGYAYNWVDIRMRRLAKW